MEKGLRRSYPQSLAAAVISAFSPKGQAGQARRPRSVRGGGPEGRFDALRDGVAVGAAGTTAKPEWKQLAVWSGEA